MRRLGWSLFGLVVLLVVGGGLFWRHLHTSLPQLEGTITVTGPAAPVTIARDQYGIPHIEAQSKADALFALGFVHAQDRLWQMEMNRRIAQGRIAETTGAGAELDHFLRTVNFYGRAQADAATLDGETRALLQAYADGINAFLDTRTGALPIEFVVLGVKPGRFTIADSLAQLRLMSLDLGFQWRDEVTRLQFLSRMTPEQLWQIMPPYPGDPALPLPTLAELIPGLPKPTQAAVEPADEAKGSNNWVLAGSRTTTGKPLLANDPHLGLTAPSLWYLAHLKIAGQSVVGATMPSLPLVVLGRTDRLAWGFTNTGPDTQDLIVEKLVPGGVARADGSVVPITSRTETIKVRFRNDKTVTIRETSNGPIVSDALEDLKDQMGDTYALALRWTALDANDTTMQAGLGVMRAQSTADLVQSLRQFISPQQNVVYADVEGTIGIVSPARVPIRKPDSRTQGLMPTPGWTGEADWVGSIPFEGLPQSVNPASGYIATANQKIVGPDYPYVITYDWEEPHRQNRIVAMIEAQPRHDLASMKRMHADVMAPNMAALRDALLAAGPFKGAAPELIEGLRRWDGSMAGDRWEPSVIHAWNRALVRRITQDELGPLFEDHWRLRSVFVTDALTNRNGEARWCDDTTTPAVEACPALAERALGDALAELRSKLGADFRTWRWDTMHHAVNEHRVFEHLGPLRNWFSIRNPVGGSQSTVNVAHPRLRGDRPYDARLMASYRAIYDLADLDRSLYVIPTGQSGNVLSPHYKDLNPLWARVDYITIPTAPEAVRGTTRHRLTLQPAGR
jgi:penicillin amidase